MEEGLLRGRACGTRVGSPGVRALEPGDQEQQSCASELFINCGDLAVFCNVELFERHLFFKEVRMSVRTGPYSEVVDMVSF